MYHVQPDPAGDSHLFNLFLATPERVIFEEDVISVILPGKEGSFEILTRHAPLMGILKKGLVVITNKDKKVITWEVSGGFIEVSHNKASILADDAIDTTNVSKD